MKKIITPFIYKIAIVIFFGEFAVKFHTLSPIKATLGVEMKFFKTIVAAAIALASIGAAQAQNLYGGVGFAKAKIDTDVGSFSPSLLVFSLGYSVNKYFAIEGRLGTNASSGSADFLGVPVSLNVDSFSAVYLKGIVPVNDQFSLYGMYGYNNMQSTMSAVGQSFSETNSGGTYGAGAEFAATKDIAFTGEWARNYSNGTSMAFGVKYKF